jgi:taurine dioxygenase
MIGFNNMKIREMRQDFGLEILDIDLSGDISNEVFDEILEYYYRYSLLLFRNQNLSPKDQARLCHRFGQPKIETRKQYNYQECPEVSTIGNITNDQGKPLSFLARGGFGWHTDGAAACHVDAATMLYAVDVPKVGGDTLFLSSASAYESSSSELQRQLEKVSFLASFHAHNDPLYESDPDSFIALTPAEREALPPVWHDLIQIHPVTGRKVYYLNLDPIEFRGIDDETGRQIISQIIKLASRPEYVYRHCWQPGELVIWDNHSMLHSGTPSHLYESDRRLMHRSFVYTKPTQRPLTNYDEVSRIFMPDQNSIQLSDFDVASFP